MTAYPLTALVTLLIFLLMLATGVNVGRARVRYAIKAPAVNGHEMFERAYRVQMNTLENTAMMLPALWVNAGFISDRGAAALGMVWLASRMWYALVYQRDPTKRGAAFGLSILVFTLLWLAAAYGVGRILIHS